MLIKITVPVNLNTKVTKRILFLKEADPQSNSSRRKNCLDFNCFQG